jgi:import inner membrane translocase subunit TIM50
MAGVVNMCVVRKMYCGLQQPTQLLLLNFSRIQFPNIVSHITRRSTLAVQGFSTRSGCGLTCRFGSGSSPFGLNGLSKALLTAHSIRRTEPLALFSAQQKPSLTEEILKSKIPQSPSGPTSSGPENDSKANKKTPTENADSWFSGKNAWKLGLLSLVGMGILMCGNMLAWWGRPKLDEDGDEIPDEFTQLPKWQAYPKRALKELRFFTKMIQEPSSLKLLPDPLKEPYYQPPYTLVLEMTGVLVHPDWTLSTGWRFKKRPGLDFFLQQISPPLFEVVIYTHEQGLTAFPIIDGLDPNGHVMFRLFRDATRYVNGAHVKDLACLNRDLSKVIIIDCDPKAISLQPQNAFLLRKWNGDDSDRELIDLAAFLRTIAVSEVEDVRTVLEYYSQFDDPIAAFKEKQRQLQEQQEQQLRAIAEQKNKKGVVGGWSFGLTGLRKPS